MSRPTLLVTGASGNLGRAVLDALLEKKASPIVATTRDPSKLKAYADRGVEVRAASFDDPASMAKAFQGADRALLISTDAIDKPGHRPAQHIAAIKAMETAGVKHVIYTSLPDPQHSSTLIAKDHADTEAALVASKLTHTILRNNMYLHMQPFPQALQSGEFVDARGSGATAFVTREDCARAAAGALADATLTSREVLDVTGPEALNSDQLAALLTEIFKKPVKHVSVPTAAMKDGLMKHGLPAPIADVIVSFDIAISKGELARITDTVQRFSGKPAQSVRAYLQAHHAELSGK
jgi:NAD(P)H dehydrogenase (quinone)